MSKKSEVKAGEPIQEIPMKDGKVDFRQNHGCCRDFYCLIVFGICIIAMFVIFGLGFIHGEPYKLAYPYTTDKEFCGVKNKINNYQRRKYLFQDPFFSDNVTEVKTYCLEECPYKGFQCIDLETGMLTTDDEYTCTVTHKYYTNETKFYSLMYRCIPSSVQDRISEIPGFDDMKNVFTTFVSDITQGWYILLLAAAFALVICFLEICCFQCCGFCIVWICILGCLVAVAVVGIWIFVYGFSHYRDPLQHDKTSSYVFIGFGGFLILLDFILVIITIALRRRISLATAIIKEASRAIRSMCCIILVPIVYIIIFIIVAALFVITMVYYFSQHVVIPESFSETRSITIDSTSRYVILFVFFFFLWCISFLIGMNQSTVAGAGATWFFVHDKSDVPTFPIARATKILLLHHLGSVSVGSFMIALVQLFRTIVLYLRKKVEDINNPVIKGILCCCSCCLKCCQKLVEFIASRAYIMMMIHGKSFFPSAVDALNIMVRNVLRTSVLSVLTTIIIMCAILASACLSTFCCVLFMRPDFVGVTFYKLTINYWWFLALLSFIIAFVVSFLVMEIYDSLIDTIFMCFLQDEEIAKAKGATYAPYSSQSLKEYMDGVQHRGEEDVEEKEERKKKYLEDREAKKLAKQQQLTTGTGTASSASASMGTADSGGKTAF
ncbi:putative Choline Transporter-like (CTL) Family Protein [Monocercomonoides exilis]|uniref:putative Choline Transporter-like (CTL) Family Protein n=1 Tax=Monocercomonoides exilis TaxID=2049356 RepID=UPI00355971C7|nr:putative Choline Transporter-like (CTL) Family Protein [Monocercomonoides exilis]|eukprot:MONOS_7116.1-p1 / transcript=MONOS_7116.1 / gene=MONOS_7116 / organism=Monocercomonoides_exilis_PA203 / gene_product=Choline Transporter-like (CTL) Family Protein / transcript_product=Choline Transporter-like (CTL) Family Protein / location=Mono_scaffold00236:70078-72192(+) / protein_length=665 / sequence_SO=supercontig / SO=protein_coding / is_pseudo=false